MFGVASELQVCFAGGSANVLSHSQRAGPALELPPQWYSHTGTWKMEMCM